MDTNGFWIFGFGFSSWLRGFAASREILELRSVFLAPKRRKGREKEDGLVLCFL